MKGLSFKVFALLTVAALLLAACAQATPTAPPEEEKPEPTAPPAEEAAPTEAPPPEAVEVTLTIGYTASITGKYEVSSAAQVNALMLWMEQTNAAGGVELSDGTVVKFDHVFYDDESTTERVQELYTRLATEDDADFLISPYSSGLTSASSVLAEQYGKIMITTGAADDLNYMQGYTQVFQSYTPSSRYLTGAVDLLAVVDPSVTKIAFVYENDKFSTSVVTAAKDYAEAAGYDIVLFEGYDSETTDFSPFINKIEAAGPEAIMGGGHRVDGKAFAMQIFEKGTPVKFFALLVAPPEPEFAELGDAALGVIGPSQWEPLFATTPESAAEVGIEWFGPLGSEFTEAFIAKTGAEPSYHAAGGYVAGLMLEKAIRDADSIDPAAVKAALDNMDLMTFYGHIKFDITPEAHGLQIGHSMVYVQWQRDEAGNLVKQVVWPLEGATAETIYPLR
jgi:ABC-type branched-subunit amino acid transport system substrate-binding protein